MNTSTAITCRSTEPIGRRWRFILPAVAALAVLAGAVGPAQSAFPGRSGLIAFTSTRDVGFPELFLLDTATLQATKVAEVATEGGVSENPVWSPDGSKIAFSRAGWIEVYDVATGGLQTINDDSAQQPAWSPDGSKIAFTRFDEGRRGIWRMNADGSGEIRLTHGEHQDPAWSPDGGSIAFTKRRHFAEFLTDGVYAMNPDGSGQVRVDHEIYCCSQTDPAWSPDGQRIALVEDFGGGSRIGVLDVDLNDGANPITDFSHDFAPAWSPDGTQIVFERATAAAPRALFAVTLGAPNGPTQLTGNPPAWDTSPDWQPLPTAAGASPKCSIGATRADEGNGGVVQASFEVDCDNPTPDTHSLDYATSDAPGHTGTAQPHQDYLPAAGSVAVPPGKSHAQVHVSLVGDTQPEPHETLWVRISSNGFVIDNDAAQASATIVDDDGFQVSVEAKTVVEGDNGSTDIPVRVRLSHPADQLVDVFVHAVTPAGARSGYHDVNFAPGETEKVIAYPVPGDSAVEGDERVEFAPVSWLVTDANSRSGFLTIVDDDDEATLTIEDFNVPEGGSGPTTAMVTRSNASASVSFDYAIEDGTATEGDDFAPGQGNVSFAAGELTATVPVEVTDDDLDEPDETFAVRLSNPVNATVGDEGVGIATIEDDDPEPSLSIADMAVDEGNAGATTARLTVSLSASSGKRVTVVAATEDDTARTPGDYTEVGPKQLDFDPGETTATFDVPIVGDLLDEPSEMLVVRLSSAVNATISGAPATVTIRDDDPEPSLSIDDVQVIEGHTGTVTASFTVSLSAPSGKTVAVNASTADGTARAPGDYSGITATTLTFAPGRTTEPLDVRVNGDTDFEGDETFTVELSGVQNASIGDGDGVGTIVDDEGPANDDFADAAPLAAGTTAFDTSFASIETDEPGLIAGTPQHYPSVWYRLSPGRGSVELSASGLLVSTRQVSVYTGASLGGLTLHARINLSDTPSGGTIHIAFPTVAGQEYLVQVLSSSAAVFGSPGIGRGTLSMAFHTAPANDDFEEAAALGPGTTSFDTSLATLEVDEPGLAPVMPERHPSVWYRLSPGAGGVALRARNNGAPQRVSVYAGTSLGGLALLARAEHADFPLGNMLGSIELEFMASAGQEYLVQVVGSSAFERVDIEGGVAFLFDRDRGRGWLEMEFHPAPANDDFAAAEPLGAGMTHFATSFASVETGEPGLAWPGPETYPSVWYQLNPGLGTAALQAHSTQPRQVSVYTGTSLDTLTLVSRASTPSPFPGGVGDPVTSDLDLDFRTVCGTSYYVQILGPWAFPRPGQPTFEPLVGNGEVTHQFQPTPLPTNDAFANAISLSEGRTTLPRDWWTCMTAEPGEPPHGGAPAARSVWYRTTVGSGRVTVDSPGNRVAVYQGGTNLATLMRVADGSSGRASFLTPGGTFLVAVEGISGTTVDLSHTPGEVVTTTGGSLTTDNELPLDGATPSDPIETTLNGPPGSRKTIFETQGATPPTAWTFLGWTVEIVAPPLSPPNLYTITFRIDASLLVGVTGQLDVFRNGVAVRNCSPAPAPDPCVFSQTAVSGDRIIIVRTTHASEWTLGTPRKTRGGALGRLGPSSGGEAEFIVGSDGATVGGAFSYDLDGKRFVATAVNALAIQGPTAWFAGFGRDARPFLVYVEDYGPGSSDRFRLWIGGVERTHTDGRLGSGGLTIRS